MFIFGKKVIELYINQFWIKLEDLIKLNCFFEKKNISYIYFYSAENIINKKIVK